MDAPTFDRLSRSLWLTGSRRTALRALLGSAAAARGLAGTDRVIAQEVCKADGQRCSDGSECCSGRCHRRHRSGPPVCRQGGNQGVCTVQKDWCASETRHLTCGTNSVGSCECYLTTRGHSFCGTRDSSQPRDCGCSRSKECERRLGRGARCIRNIGGCDCPPENLNFCIAPCENLAPVP